MLLDAAGDDIPEPDNIRRLMRDLREVRMAKMRAGVSVLEGGREVKMNGVGGYVLYKTGGMDKHKTSQWLHKCPRYRANFCLQHGGVGRPSFHRRGDGWTEVRSALGFHS